MTIAPPRLALALLLAGLVMAYSAGIDYLGPPGQSALRAAIKPLVFVALVLLVALGHVWARWLLCAWLAIGVMVGTGALVTLGGIVAFPRALLGCLMVLVLAWAAVELVVSTLETPKHRA